MTKKKLKKNYFWLFLYTLTGIGLGLIAIGFIQTAITRGERKEILMIGSGFVITALLIGIITILMYAIREEVQEMKKNLNTKH